MKIDGPWREDPAARSVLTMLSGAGHRALLVGGCVRNAVLGAPVSDLDIATDAHPDTVMRLAEAAGLKPVPTGVTHGTVTVVAEGRPHEVTTFRRDVETDGRRAVVAYAEDVAEDAARRDFTMNALYAEADGTLVDPLGGIEDCRSRRVRFIGEPRARIAEDYLRILRYFRFHAWYGAPEEGLDAEALAACAEMAEGIEQLSAERIGAETLKLLTAPDPAPSVAAMSQSGILARVLPGADPAALAVLVHLEGILGVDPDPLRRLAALGGEDPGDRLRLSRKQAETRTRLVAQIGSDPGASELAWRYGPETARDVELLRAASFAAPLPVDLQERIDRGAAVTFPVRGADLAGRYEGPEIGRHLRDLEQRWIASGFSLSRAELLD